MLSLAGDKSLTDIVFISMVAKEHHGNEQTSPAFNISIDSTIFRIDKLFLEVNEPINNCLDANFNQRP